jgi:hypothetical protein
MRIPYFSSPSPGQSTGDASTDRIISSIAARRQPGALQELDLALLHSAPYAAGWSAFLGAIRTQTLLSADIKELIICTVAAANEGWYGTCLLSLRLPSRNGLCIIR